MRARLFLMRSGPEDMIGQVFVKLRGGRVPPGWAVLVGIDDQGRARISMLEASHLVESFDDLGSVALPGKVMRFALSAWEDLREDSPELLPWEGREAGSLLH